jgi:ribosomal-protein-alanine N-acetyltransferase
MDNNADLYAIRSLIKEDASFIMHLQHQSTGTPWTLESTRNLLEDTTMKGWGIQEKDTLVGFILMQITGESADLMEFVVEEPYRHQGLGKRLYASMEKNCMADGLKEIFLEVSALNILGHLFYKKQGFMAVGVRQGYYTFLDGKVDAILMKKQLV